MMDKKDTQHYAQLLRAMREAMAEADASVKEAAKPVELDQARMGRLSRMEDMQAQAIASALNRRRDVMQQRIDGALERIEKGGYGVCLVCKTPIDARRLNFDPTAALCPPCAEKAEARRRT